MNRVKRRGLGNPTRRHDTRSVGGHTAFGEYRLSDADAVLPYGASNLRAQVRPTAVIRELATEQWHSDAEAGVDADNDDGTSHHVVAIRLPKSTGDPDAKSGGRDIVWLAGISAPAYSDRLMHLRVQNELRGEDGRERILRVVIDCRDVEVADDESNESNESDVGGHHPTAPGIVPAVRLRSRIHAAAAGQPHSDSVVDVARGGGLDLVFDPGHGRGGWRLVGVGASPQSARLDVTPSPSVTNGLDGGDVAAAAQIGEIRTLLDETFDQSVRLSAAVEFGSVNGRNVALDGDRLDALGAKIGQRLTRDATVEFAHLSTSTAENMVVVSGGVADDLLARTDAIADVESKIGAVDRGRIVDLTNILNMAIGEPPAILPDTGLPDPDPETETQTQTLKKDSHVQFGSVDVAGGLITKTYRAGVDPVTELPIYRDLSADIAMVQGLPENLLPIVQPESRAVSGTLTFTGSELLPGVANTTELGTAAAPFRRMYVGTGVGQCGLGYGILDPEDNPTRAEFVIASHTDTPSDIVLAEGTKNKWIVSSRNSDGPSTNHLVIYSMDSSSLAILNVTPVSIFGRTNHHGILGTSARRYRNLYVADGIRSYSESATIASCNLAVRKTNLERLDNLVILEAPTQKFVGANIFTSTTRIRVPGSSPDNPGLVLSDDGSSRKVTVFAEAADASLVVGRNGGVVWGRGPATPESSDWYFVSGQASGDHHVEDLVLRRGSSLVGGGGGDPQDMLVFSNASATLLPARQSGPPAAGVVGLGSAERPFKSISLATAPISNDLAVSNDIAVVAPIFVGADRTPIGVRTIPLEIDCVGPWAGTLTTTIVLSRMSSGVVMNCEGVMAQFAGQTLISLHEIPTGFRPADSVLRSIVVFSGNTTVRGFFEIAESGVGTIGVLDTDMLGTFRGGPGEEVGFLSFSAAWESNEPMPRPLPPTEV